jgi:hypothetical protein
MSGESIMIWEKPYILALTMLGTNISVGLFLGLLEGLTGTETRIQMGVQFLSAFTTGQVYAWKCGNLMPSPTRFRATAWYAGILMPLNAIIILILCAAYPKIPHYFVLLALLAPIVFAPLIYFLLGYGAKSYLKKMRR